MNRRANTLIVAPLAASAAVLFAMSLPVEWGRLRTAIDLHPRSWAEKHLTYESKVPDDFFAFADDCARVIPEEAWVLFVTTPDLAEGLYFRMAYLLYPRAVVPLDLGHLAFRNLAPYGGVRREDLDRVSYAAFYRFEPRGSILRESDPVFASAGGSCAVRRLRGTAGAPAADARPGASSNATAKPPPER